MPNHDIVFSMNIVGGDEYSRARCIMFGPVPPTSGHLSCTDAFAWSRGCPFMTGTTLNIIISEQKIIQLFTFMSELSHMTHDDH